MPWNGAGTYSPPVGSFPESNGTIIDAVRFDATINDLATGITASLAKNGENIATANLPMGGFKHTGVGDAVAAGQYLAWGQTSSMGRLLGALGAVGAPSYTFIGDLTTGWWSPAASTQAWSLGAAEAMRLSATGLGIGIAATSKLDVFGNYISVRDGTFTSFFGRGSDLVTTGTTSDLGIRSSTGSIVFSAGGPTEGFRIKSTGVGVNSSPSAGVRFNVLSANTSTTAGGSVATDLAVRISSNAAGADASICLTDGLVWNAFWGVAGAGAAAEMYWSHTGSGVFGKKLALTSDGRFYGTALHNNAGAVTGTTNQYLASGTYTPTLTNVANVAASTAAVSQWVRVGNVVTVGGTVLIDPTATSTLTQLDLSLPIASGFVSGLELGGTAGRNSAATVLVGAIFADPINDRASLVFNCDGDATNRSWSFHFTYLIV